MNIGEYGKISDQVGFTIRGKSFLNIIQFKKFFKALGKGLVMVETQ